MDELESCLLGHLCLPNKYMIEDDWSIFAIEVEPDNCLLCQYGEIPDDANIPFELCVKHLDITKFILDKANIPCIADRMD